MASIAGPTLSSGEIPGVAAAPADAFASSVGVDTHFNYPGTPYTDSFPTIAAELIASGIRHVQDGGPKFSRPQALAYLGRHGITHSLGFPVTTTAQEIATTLEANAPYVDFVEPQNEYDLKSKIAPDWVSAWRNEQELLYRTVRSNNANHSIVVLGAAIGHYNDAAALGSLDQFEDAGAMHYYPCSDYPGDTRANVSLAKALTFQRLNHPSKPIWTTETGYPDDLPDGRCSLADTVIAKYDTRAIAEHWLAHQPRTFFYQFADMGTVHGYDSMGLVTTNGTPKPQYHAIQSLLHAVSDPGTPFTAAPLTYSLTGQTDDVHQLLLEKRDKTYFLLLWLEVPSWDAGTHGPRDVPAQRVTIDLSKTPAFAEQLSYDSAWSFKTAPLQPSRTIQVPVTDGISIVELRQ